MLRHLTTFFETLYYRPGWVHRAVGFLLFPIALLYGSIMWVRRKMAVRRSFRVPIVSLGNLIVGGSGKTPMAIALARLIDRPAVILRGYGRRSKGLQIVSRRGEILCDVAVSGDEAMLIARQASNATVIVSEERQRAIKVAIELGATVVILDDGFNRVDIEKYEILLYPKKIVNYLPLPAGPFREFFWSEKAADLVMVEERDFRRQVTCRGCDAPMLLVTAIANPERLEPFLPARVVGRMVLEDHAWFDEAAISRTMQQCGAVKILTTQKDAVKMQDFSLPLALLELELEIDKGALDKILSFIQQG